MSSPKAELKRRLDTPLQTKIIQKSSDSKLLKLLPDEILETIFGMLSFADGKRLYHVNKYIKNLIKKEHFEFADGRRLDFLLMMDVTGSMGSYLEEAKLALENLILSVRNHQQVQRETKEAETLEGRKKYHLRTAWLEYRDFKDPLPIKSHDFTQDSSEIVAAMADTEASGGGDYPENVAGALQHALSNLQWTKTPYCHAVRVIVLVLDAPPHGMGGTYMDDYPEDPPAPFAKADWIEIAHKMKKQNIIVHTILCRDDVEQLNLFGATLSNITGGKSIYMKDTQCLADFILANICADIELEEILSKKLNEIAPDISQSEAERKRIGERLFQVIAEDPSLTIPTVEARPVTHVMAATLSRMKSVYEARRESVLPDAETMRRAATAHTAAARPTLSMYATMSGAMGLAPVPISEGRGDDTPPLERSASPTTPPLERSAAASADDAALELGSLARPVLRRPEAPEHVSLALPSLERPMGVEASAAAAPAPMLLTRTLTGMPRSSIISRSPAVPPMLPSFLSARSVSIAPRVPLAPTLSRAVSVAMPEDALKSRIDSLIRTKTGH